MLVYLGIQDLTLIENARLEMSAGLNVLSGESGAGKSVVLDALGFVAGQTRARAKVRAPAALGQVEALFELSEEDRRALAPILERLELPLDRELSLSRRIDANGRSRCFVQGSLVPARILGDIAEQLIEFSDQGDSHALRSPQAQLELLDGCAGLEPLRLAYQEPYQLWLRSTVELEEVQRRAAEAERRRDFLEFQLNELAGCAELDFARETEQ
ncbi:MAG TPA: hypothetical protein VLC09_16195, partial [Polyangiaceae bacterium]|nr:hypothetical protein [Polyangiaceae bacterium]